MKTNPIKRVHPASIALLTDASWEFTHTQLYGNYFFNKEETQSAKKQIKQYYEDILPELFVKHSATYFSYFCERVLMAKRYVMRRVGRFIPAPSVWFNPGNQKGFAGTKRWLMEDLATQKKNALQFHYNNGRMERKVA